jgi:hypothetical protein
MIPAWEMSGVLPPIRPGEQGHSCDRSPYVTSLHHIVERFATSVERIDILQGYLNYRHEMHILGIELGFQWLNGSFMEQVELLEARPPNDLDVVTFFYLPVGTDQQAFAERIEYLFDHRQTKERFHVDAFPFLLGEPTENRQVRQVAYWYSMWSHRRYGEWKGFLQVDLSPREDGEAFAALAVKRQQGGLL